MTTEDHHNHQHDTTTNNISTSKAMKCIEKKNITWKKMKCKTKERRKKNCIHKQRDCTPHTLEWHGRENDDETISLIVQRQRREITNMRLLVFFLARFISAHARKTNWKHFQFLTAMVILFNHSAVCTRTIVRCAAVCCCCWNFNAILRILCQHFA